MRDGIAHLELLLPPAPNGAPWLSDMKAHLSSTNWRMSANICVLFGGGHGVGMSQWCRAWGTGEWPPTASLQNFQPPSFVPVPLVCARDSALSRAVIAALAYTRCHTRAAVQGRPEFKGGVLSAPAQRPEGHGPRFVGSFVDVLASRAPQRMGCCAGCPPRSFWLSTCICCRRGGSTGPCASWWSRCSPLNDPAGS